MILQWSSYKLESTEAAQIKLFGILSGVFSCKASLPVSWLMQISLSERMVGRRDLKAGDLSSSPAQSLIGCYDDGQDIVTF